MDRRPGRPREAKADERIVQATLELLREQGPTAVNVASVATRSGVARTTIYRRFPDRAALLATALRGVTARGRPSENLTVRERLEWVLASTEQVITHGIGAGGVAAVLTDSDPEFTGALRESLQEGLRPIAEQIEQDIDRSALDAGLDADFVLNLILGSYLADSLRHGTPDTEWKSRTANLLGDLLVANLDR